MNCRIEKEIQDDGCKILSMFDKNDTRICHICTEPKTIAMSYEIIEDCVVSLCQDCANDLELQQDALIKQLEKRYKFKLNE